MSGFTEIASLSGMKKFYGAVVEKINLPNHKDFLSRPIKVLDICGGIGAVGSLLHQQCEGLTGRLSREDFAELVDYVNIDVDDEALKQSPGRTRWEDATYLYARLEGESPFDFVLALNQDPQVPQFSSTRLNNMGLRNEFMGNPIRDNLMADPHALRNLTARAILVSSALVLQAGGLYLWSGFIEQDSFQGTAQVSRELGLGLRIIADDHIALDETTINSFVSYDSRKSKGKQFARIQEQYKKTFRLVTLRAKGISNLDMTQADLSKTLQELQDWSDYCDNQDRFWS